MADQITIKSGTAEQVALDLTVSIWRMEHAGRSNPTDGVRGLYLALYGECLRTVRSGGATRADLSGH